jgi:Cof subfamily protein (haloacid dehalogenase superfamily)
LGHTGIGVNPSEICNVKTPLYISDLDGTLLMSDASLSPFSKGTLSQLLKEGLPFTVATARSVVSAAMMLGGLKLPLPIIEFNGAFLSDLETGRHEITNNIRPDIVEDLYQLLVSFRCVPFVSSFNGTEDCVYYRDISNDGMRWYLNDRLRNKDKRWRTIDDLTQSFRDQVVCLTVIGDTELLVKLEDAVKERHGAEVVIHLFENQYSPGWYWLTIHDRKATKDQAIRILVDNYGLRDSEIVVFGDQTNDLSMFRVADRAVAVGNATAELMRHATCVIGPNDEDSVVKFISHDWTARKSHT